MKKWVKRNRKRIFAVLMVLVFSILTIIPICAAIDSYGYENPWNKVINKPSFSDYQYYHKTYSDPLYRPSYASSTYDDMLPVVTVNVNAVSAPVVDDMNGENTVIPTMTKFVLNPTYYSLQGDDSLDTTSNGTIHVTNFGRMKYTTTLMQFPEQNFTYECNIVPSSFFESLYFTAHDFFYAPYEDSDDIFEYSRILEIVFYESYYAENHSAFTVSGTCGYVGGAEMYNFSYDIDLTSFRQLRIDYYDIVAEMFSNDDDAREDALAGRAALYFEYLEIKPKDGYIHYTGNSFDFTVKTRAMSTDEFEMQYNNNYYIAMGSAEFSDTTLSFGWILDGISGFFAAPILGGMSIGVIVVSIVSVTLALSILKMFAGST